MHADRKCNKRRQKSEKYHMKMVTDCKKCECKQKGGIAHAVDK